MTAKLPNSLLQTNTIAQMKVGEVRWVVPWAMSVDENMDCWLCGTYTTSKSPGGTVQMRIERLPNGFEVEPPADEKYQPGQRNPWYGISNNDLLSVYKVI